MQNSELFDALADMLGLIKAKTFCETLGDVESKALVIKMHLSLAEWEAKTQRCED